MVFLNEGVNRVRDLFEEDVFKCQAGEGQTAPSASDTGLETPDSTTLLTPDTVVADKAIQVTHTINSAIGGGTTYAEQETQLDSGDTSANRIVHTPLAKGASDEFIYITTFFLRSI